MAIGPREAGAGSDEPASRPREELWLATAAFALALALSIPALQILSHIWRDSDFYGHAYAIPLVAAYLAWTRRAELRSALRPLRPPPFGWVVAFTAATFEVLMVIGDVGFAAGLGVPLLLGAVAWATGGPALLRPLGLPLVFLALMVPPPRFLLYGMLFRLKLFVTDVALAILHAAGATVAAEGNTILLPGHTLFVADACSGLTSIVTLLPLACVVAYFLSRGVWRRVVVVASVVPLAIAANVARVVVTVAMVSRLGTDAAQGLLHESFGVATYVVGTLAVIGVARVLR
jgi:exosortase